MNKLKRLLNTSLLSNRHKQYLLKNKSIGTQEIDGDVYIKGIGGYDGTNAGATGVKTLQEVIESISSGIKTINITAWNLHSIEDASKSELALALGCSEADVDEIFTNNVGQLKLFISYGGRKLMVLKVSGDYKNDIASAIFGSTPNSDTGFGVSLYKNKEFYNAYYYEI